MRVFLLSLLLVFAVTGLCLESSLMAELRSRVLMTSITDFAKFPILVHTPDFALTSSAEGPPSSCQATISEGNAGRYFYRMQHEEPDRVMCRTREHTLVVTPVQPGTARLPGFLHSPSAKVVNRFRFS